MKLTPYLRTLMSRALLCGIVFLPLCVVKADAYYYNTGTGNWNAAQNWLNTKKGTTNKIPGGTDTAGINNGNVVTISDTRVVSQLQVSNAASGTGTLIMNTGANLTVSAFTAFGVANASTGNLVLTGGILNASPILGYGAGGTGIATISGGTLNGSLGIGKQTSTSLGRLTQTGGTVAASTITLGATSGVGGSFYSIGGGQLNWGGSFFVNPNNTLTVTGSTATIAYTGVTNTASHVFRNTGTLNMVLDTAGVSPINLGSSMVGISTASTLTVDGSAYSGRSTTQISLIKFGQSDMTSGYGQFGSVNFTGFSSWLTPSLVYTPTSINLLLTAAPGFAVRTYGAIPDQTTDSGPAIRAAVAAAKASGGSAQVVFENGSYRIGSVPGGDAWWPKAALVVAHADNILLVGGNNTTLVVTDPESAGIVLNDCRNVAIMDLAVDYSPTPFVLSTITAITPGSGSTPDTISVQLAPGHLDLVDFNNSAWASPYPILAMSYFIGTDGRPVYNPYRISHSVVAQTGSDTWKLSTPAGNAALAGLRVGDTFYSRYLTSAAVSFLFSNNVSADNVTIHASPGHGFFPALSSGITLSNCAISAGGSRIFSTNTDGVHATSNRGITIKNCIFKGMGDDSINLHNGSMLPLQRLSDTTFVFKHGMYTVKVGDLIEAIRPETGAIIGKHMVASVIMLGAPNYDYQVTFGGTFGSIVLSNGTASLGDQFFNLSEAHNNFLIENNTFGRHFGREILISAYQGTVQNNLFDNGGFGNSSAYFIPATSSNTNLLLSYYNTFTTAVQLSYQPSWGEGPIAEEINILNNNFMGKGTYSSSIWIGDYLRPTGNSVAVSHNNINISANVFVDIVAPATALNYASGLIFNDNSVITTGAPKPTPPNPVAFKIKGCPNPTTLSNTSSDPAFITVLRVE